MKIHQINILNSLKYKLPSNKIYLKAPSNGKFEACQYDVNIFKNQFTSFKGIDDGIYVVFNDGSYERIDSIQEAAQKFNTNTQRISRVLKGSANSANGLFFAKAYEVEKRDIDGNLILNIQKLKQLALDSSGAIYLIRSDGSYKKYFSREEITKELGISKQVISKIIIGLLHPKEYTIKRVQEIESIDDNGEVQVNIEQAKLDIIASQLENKPPKKSTDSLGKLNKKYKRIYAYGPHGQFFEFPTLQETSKELNIDIEELKEHIKLTTQSKNGFVFTTEADK